MSNACATALRTARLTARLTQVELAERLGVQQSRISEAETGTHEPRLNFYQRWLETCESAAKNRLTPRAIL